VFLDGSFQSQVDTFGPNEVQAVLFTATNLAAGTHTLAIQVTGQMNAASTGSLVAVDAVDARARIEDPDPSITYSSGWMRNNYSKEWSGESGSFGTGSASLTRTLGEQATVSFTGTSVSWIGLRAPFTGIARVSVDGAFLSEVDTYSPTEDLQRALFTATGLTDGPHTLMIEVTGRRNPSATDSLVIVDAFDLTLSPSAPPVTRREEADPSATYAGTWSQGVAFNFWSGEKASLSGEASAQVTFTFSGKAVRWIGTRSFNGGIANVLLDGVQVAQIDTYAPVQEEYQASMYSATGLADASHTLTIVGTGQKNPASQNTWIIVDAFDVY
jgi:hypothetical protein